MLKWRVPRPGPEVRGLCAASELACSIVARKLGLTVPDYGVIHLPDALVEAVWDPEIRRRVEENIGPNFGCRYIPAAQMWSPQYSTRAEELLLSLENCVSFDASTMNGDRTTEKPNLLWTTDGIVMIDHALAAQPWLHGGNDSTLYPQASVQSHASYGTLRRKSRKYSGLYDEWRDLLCADFWTELGKAIPPQWRQESRGEVDRMMNFFRNRVAVLASQTTELQGVLQ